MRHNKFAESLAQGQLAFASNMAAQKVHVVRLRRSAFDDDSEGLSRAKIAKIDPDRRGLWSAQGICGTRGERTTYGSRHSYYWHPLQTPSMENVCKGCMGEWRKRGEPEIAGWDRSTPNDQEWPWTLPFGWIEAPAEGHPWDVPVDKPIESVKDKTGAVVGQHRVELRRWSRGPRIVRLVHHLDTDTYAARHWRHDAGPDGERHATRGTMQNAMQACQMLMARGGY